MQCALLCLQVMVSKLVSTYKKVLFHHSPGVSQKTPENSVVTVDLPAKIQN